MLYDPKYSTGSSSIFHCSFSFTFKEEFESLDNYTINELKQLANPVFPDSFEILHTSINKYVPSNLRNPLKFILTSRLEIDDYDWESESILIFDEYNTKDELKLLINLKNAITNIA